MTWRIDMSPDINVLRQAKKEGKNLVIYAPHCDDELIGCYSLISQKVITHVVVSDCKFERLSELAILADYKDFKIFTDQNFPDIEIEHAFIPSAFDTHPLHQSVRNSARKGTFNWYYSVDLQNSRDKIELPTWENKLHWLNFIYPSQKSLWENDASYYLFESIHDKDWIEYNEFSLKVGSDCYHLLLDSSFSKANGFSNYSKADQIVYTSLRDLYLSLGSSRFKLYRNSALISER
jgi:hypothetical protein